ncbi:glutathione synthase [Altererythrobacter aurantiacus]|uniref:Glutathione synthetase n=1 Tax=Parapontixanthobacter aurantiacus TaxID=1463599 RepID=A0A844Z9N3_9SPHN|nr:glutathione synthase [Parapontixanthobacter aurantiacus]MXO85291.1 glutathione synthase [Parapontixanthobacter aurantiacus]
MALRIAVQMDPLETINIAGDSSFALMMAAQDRGHEIYHYDVETLSWESDDTLSGKLWAHGRRVEVRRVEGDHFEAGEMQMLDLAQDIDVVLMRQDPPFDLGYITAAFLLDRLKGTTLVVNDPREVVNAPEKMFVLDYARFMPPTLIARNLDDVRRFQKEHGAIVVKPLHGNGGKAIFKIEEDGTNLSALFELFDRTWPEAHMIQKFLPEVSAGDKRIVLIDGEFAGAINRKPGEGEFRSNLAQGGYAEAAELTKREKEICTAMGPELKRRGLTFVGIDVIGGKWLTEINVTSPTGIVAIDRYNGTDSAGAIWDSIERRHAQM